MVEQKLLVPEVGQLYRVVHTLQGSFEGKVLHLDTEFVDMEVTKGEAGGGVSNRGPGSRVSVRRSFTCFYLPGTGLPVEDRSSKGPSP